VFYLDTSLVVPYYCPELLSEKAETFITGNSPIAVSSLTELEMFSAVSRKVREGSLDKNDGSRILAAFLSHLDRQLYTLVPVSERHYKLARDWIGLLSNNLRSLDALHLALASVEDMALVTADQGLAKSANVLGVSCILVE
jgi:uncharacterized protein